MRNSTLSRWKVTVTDLPIRTLFREFNMDVRTGLDHPRIVNAAFKCLDIDIRRDEYRLQWGADFVRVELHDGGMIECRKI